MGEGAPRLGSMRETSPAHRWQREDGNSVIRGRMPAQRSLPMRSVGCGGVRYRNENQRNVLVFSCAGPVDGPPPSRLTAETFAPRPFLGAVRGEPCHTDVRSRLRRPAL